jgi:hypothetical protein
MSLQVGIGTSRNSESSYAAGKEACERALEKIAEHKAEMIIVLSSVMFEQDDMIKGVYSTAGGAPVVGCSTAGTITTEGPLEHVVAVLALHSDTLAFHPVKVEHISKSMREAGKSFGSQLKEKAPKVAFLFSDALSGNGTELVRGIFELMGSSFPLMGGAAGDDMNFKKTYQYFQNEALNDAVVGFGISGNVKYAVGADHGWKPIGNAHTVTRSEGTTLYELDGKPAFSLYEEYFGDRASDFKKTLSLAAVSYPLGMKTDQAEKIMIRVPLSIQNDGSIVCGAEVLQGSKIYLMIGTQQSALAAARDTAERLKHSVPVIEPIIVFLSDCVARKILYGEHGKEEIDAIRTSVGEKAQIFGFYSYGQIAPFSDTPVNINTCDPGFYEQSISIAIFGE